MFCAATVPEYKPYMAMRQVELSALPGLQLFTAQVRKRPHSCYHFGFQLLGGLLEDGSADNSSQITSPMLPGPMQQCVLILSRQADVHQFVNGYLCRRGSGGDML